MSNSSIMNVAHVAPLLQRLSASSMSMTEPIQPTQPESADRTELSDAAPSVEPFETDPALAARIAEIRARIADGTYLTPDKLDAAIEGLHRELFGS